MGRTACACCVPTWQPLVAWPSTLLLCYAGGTVFKGAVSTSLLRLCCCCVVQVDQLSQVGSMKGALKLLQAAVDQGSVSVLVKGALQVTGAGWSF